MIVESFVAGGISIGTVRCIGKEAERRQCPLHGGVARHEAAFDTHRIGRECQSDGGDAGRPTRPRLVKHQPVGGIGLVDEIAERVLLQRS